MKLKTLIAAVLTLSVAGLLSMPEPAEAKRFGGGGNVGKQYNTPHQAQPSRPTQAANQTPAQGGQAAATGARAPQASGASRWLGPLAGLAAGGLLASLFFGDAFSGFQIMDFLMILALVAGGFLLFRMLRRGRTAPRPAGAFGGAVPASAGAGAYQRQGAGLGSTAAPQGVRSGGLAMPGMGAAAPQPAGTDRFPHWFDGPAFIEGAKSHFIRLQSAWDQADFQDIREYTTPQMFAEIQREREALGGPQHTEVVRVQAELTTVQRDGDLAVASIQFSGLIREDAQGVAEEFREVWHVQHVWDSPQGDWLIAGIQQV